MYAQALMNAIEVVVFLIGFVSMIGGLCLALDADSETRTNLGGLALCLFGVFLVVFIMSLG